MLVSRESFEFRKSRGGEHTCPTVTTLKVIASKSPRKVGENANPVIKNAAFTGLIAIDEDHTRLFIVYCTNFDKPTNDLMNAIYSLT